MPLSRGSSTAPLWQARETNPGSPGPFIAMSREEILKARGTKYNISPQISWLKEATRSFGLDKVGITGVCCQMQAVRKAQLYPINMRDVPGKVALAVGLFCMENFPYKSMQTIVEDHAGQSLESVKKMEIGKGKYWVYTERGNVVTLPLKVTHKYEQPGCHVCLDYVSNLGDISTGSVGSPDGWSTVFVRTKVGNDVWSKAVAVGHVRDEAHRAGEARPRARHEAREGEARQEPEDGGRAQDLRRQQGAAGPLRLKLNFFFCSSI